MAEGFSQLLHLGVPTFIPVDALAPLFRPWNDAPSQAPTHPVPTQCQALVIVRCAWLVSGHKASAAGVALPAQGEESGQAGP